MQGRARIRAFADIASWRMPMVRNRAQFHFGEQRFGNSFLRRSVETHLGTVLIFDCVIWRELFALINAMRVNSMSAE